MDDRSTVFLEVMIGIAIVGLLAFLILLVARRVGGSSERGSEQVLGAPPWWAFLLAVGLLIIVALVVLWQFPPLTDEVGAGGWREDTGALVFFVVMLVAAGLGLITYLVFLYAGTRRPLSRDRTAVDASSDETTAATASGVGLLGVLALGVAFLILNWAYVASDLQYALMRNLLYPASFAVALVLLFDKATRAWSAKGGIATVREWLHCDWIVFLLVLGYLNLVEFNNPGEYDAVLWDIIHLALFFLVFWLLDRTVSRYRFLAAHGYLIVLPVLLLIATPAAEPPAEDAAEAIVEAVSWWSTIWPFFFLAVIFFVLEIITLVARREGPAGAVSLVKDVVFVGVYVIFFIVAIP